MADEQRSEEVQRMRLPRDDQGVAAAALGFAISGRVKRTRYVFGARCECFRLVNDEQTRSGKMGYPMAWRIDRFSVAIVSSVLLSAFVGGGSHANAGNPHCVPVGGAFMTNLGAIGGSSVPSITLGRITGDLSGSVAAEILKVERSGNNLVFTTQVHIVTDSGDFIFADQAHATVIAVPGTATPLFAVVSYPFHITGGTGKFAGATGDLTHIGEISVPNFASGDLSGATLILRYSGDVCFSTPRRGM
jgi:hypothetical protein